jgi:hypothetical protein
VQCKSTTETPEAPTQQFRIAHTTHMTNYFKAQNSSSK